MSLGPLQFAAPGALWALLALPLLYWLLRATPPAPNRISFPPLRLLLGLTTPDQTRARAPLWLVLLRGAMAALLIVGLARPSLPAPVALGGGPGGAVLLVIDDGWTSAPRWPQVRAAAQAMVGEQADAGGAPVHLLLTAQSFSAADPGVAMTPADARTLLGRLVPQPWRPDRTAALTRLGDAVPQVGRVVWLSDGLDGPGTGAFAQALASRGPLTVLTPAEPARALTSAVVEGEGVVVEARRAVGGLGQGVVAVETVEGRSLGSGEVRFAPGAVTAGLTIPLPPEIAARAARVRLLGEGSAGAVQALPGGIGRPLVGLVDAGGEGQPLLSDLFYVDRAIQPFATARRGTVETLVRQGVQAIVLPDTSRLPPAERMALDGWLEQGGLLIRFAGPRLANDVDDLIPLPLRAGERNLGGALAWETPQRLAPFAAISPFAGLPIPTDVLVRSQVLAEPGAETPGSVWARLEDGTSVITAAPRGRGLLVLVHVTAGPAWSDLPLSGLYVELLRRMLAFAGRAAQGVTAEGGGLGPWTLERGIDGFGQFVPAPPEAPTVPSDAFQTTAAGPLSPPGLYARPGSSGVINAMRPDDTLTPLTAPAGANVAPLEGSTTRALAGPLLGLALALLALDLLVGLFLLGLLPKLRWPRRAAVAVTLLAIGVALSLTGSAQAQQGNPDLVLAYVQTGDQSLDRDSRDGLTALSTALRTRTAVEPSRVIGVDLARDDLSLIPFLYWPAPANPQRLSDAALTNLDRYMRTGGMLLLDTRDAGRASQGRGPAAVLLAGLDAPPLEPITEDHVLAKAFYLLSSFPGTSPSARLWGETAAAAAQRDGVPALFVGDGSWGTAWAGRGVNPTTREQALRVGVNLVMVALTGNYKADQVHVRTLLERLDRGRGVNR